ncbi:hypothetical protein CDCA_CDCA05G1491 [Cyanidium caldarium]|uniref:peptidyl-tRNA hydrolase n=1 Tax=Cyanidium caldarium TaxID=2771 RepID=A0AAV9ITS5_CYACA|nr:hypothetical protein CDCA_CDCA05G1491 [Cyanidium caldarium]
MNAADPLVQYVVVRRDLLQAPYRWPVGALIAQGVHAAVSAVWKFRDVSDDVMAYCGEGDGTQMRTFVLESPDEASLQRLGAELAASQVQHVLWREQPEQVLTALATAPARKSRIQGCFKRFRLFR